MTEKLLAQAPTSSHTCFTQCACVLLHQGGDIDVAEMRIILREMYKDLPRKAVAVGMKEAQKFMSLN